MSDGQQFLQSRQGEEQLKMIAFGGVARERSAGAFANQDSEFSGTLYQLLQKDVFQPSLEEVLAAKDRIKNYLRSDRVKILIPMRELQANIAPMIEEIISILADYVGVENIFIVNNGLHETIKETLVSRGVCLISAAKMKERFNFPKLLGILDLPDLNFGLGFSMMSGIAYLALENIMQPDDWLVKVDGDITDFKQYLLPEYLFYPLAEAPEIEWDFLKMAKVGRNNEMVMAGINSLLPYFCTKIEKENWPLVPQSRVAREIYEACIRQIWILSGEYAIRWKRVCQQLGSTGYCNPILSSTQQGWQKFAQIVNPNPRLDMPNTKQKEDCILISIVQFIQSLVIFGKSLRNEWDIEDISRFNREIAQYQNAVVWIPEEQGTLHLEGIEPDRLFPSLETLLREGLLQ
ncbi:MAG: hypothetical protein J7647_11785 [Cyanobacteria bacterium SBLK]|nr:hypothetical protein [Cyanobacteria bacterium SBLK]